jgi:muramoyltetrapeptide carboxypeptidase
MFRLPRPLKVGDTIGIIAPASAAKRISLQKGIQYLKSQGFKVKTAINLSRGKFYLAGSDESRIESLETFFLDPEIDGIICARGGYGIMRIIDKIGYDKLSEIPPKVFVGYSDITALQMALLNKLGWISYSGPMVASDMGKEFDSFSENWLWKMVMTHPYPIELKNPPERQLTVFREGVAEGKLIGGCFSLITPLLGTSYIPSLKDAILVIEDIDEKTYHLDKLFQIARLHGVFDQIAGLIVGDFVDCLPKKPSKCFTVEDYLRDFVGSYKFPVITNFAYGHIKRRFTLPFGIRAKIETNPAKVMLLGN